MTLVLEIEYLAGVSFAAIGPDSDIPDWPPQPDRIFSALVATWAARGEDREEAAALEWLEVLAPPVVQASEAAPRTAPLVFVPPNDPRSDKQKHAKGVLPALRSRQPRRFPATRPHDPVVRLYWDKAPATEDVFAALQRLASDTAYVGHSASLTRCCFLRADDASALERCEAAQPQRRIYAGRFAELREAYEIFEKSNGMRGRPRPGARVAPVPSAEPARTNVFGERCLLLEHVEGDMPDLRACALVGKAIRDAMLSGYGRIGLDNDIPEVVSGHSPDGTPTRAPHLAVIPLPFMGFPYADGHVMGFALVPPHACAILNDETFRSAMRALAPIDEGLGRRVMTIRPGEGAQSDRAFAIDLSPTFDLPDGKRSLDPTLYTRPARTFATITPVVLDRHLKERGQVREDEIRAQIAAACQNIGLPRPDEIIADKHSAFEGSPSAYPSGASPAWMRWRQPQSLASRQLTHAVVRFSAPVQGPVILGAGRFVGLGLCRPLDPEGR